MILPVYQEIDARKKRVEQRKKDAEEAAKKRAEAEEGEEQQQPPAEEEVDDPEISDETRRAREEQETTELREQWHKNTVSEHLMHVKGVEVVFFEFQESILTLAVKLREKIDPTTGKLKVVLTKFIEDWILRRLSSFVKFNIPSKKQVSGAARQWPESEKDV